MCKCGKLGRVMRGGQYYCYEHDPVVTCEGCEAEIDSAADPHCFIDNEGWCQDEIACEACRERAYDAHQERLMSGDGPPSMQEVYHKAWKEKQELR